MLADRERWRINAPLARRRAAARGRRLRIPPDLLPLSSRLTYVANPSHRAADLIAPCRDGVVGRRARRVTPLYRCGQALGRLPPLDRLGGQNRPTTFLHALQRRFDRGSGCCTKTSNAVGAPLARCAAPARDTARLGFIRRRRAWAPARSTPPTAARSRTLSSASSPCSRPDRHACPHQCRSEFGARSPSHGDLKADAAERTIGISSGAEVEHEVALTKPPTPTSIARTISLSGPCLRLVTEPNQLADRRQPGRRAVPRRRHSH